MVRLSFQPMTKNNEPTPLHPKYRPDIDGLRAVAVLLVVGFHAFPEWIHGGFIGVDIFFVISGYLISTIIFENLEKNSFSFIDFYSRRIRRIFPALIFVLSFCFLMGWFLLTPKEFDQLGQHLVGGVGFISNFIFWKSSGYFDNAAELKPLLHLWSLGIEEQFYIVWPILLWFTWRLSVRYVIITLGLLALSFSFNIFEANHDLIADFYNPITRFWELLIGATLAYLVLYKKSAIEHLKPYQDISSCFGFLLILIAVGILNKTSLFPGWWAVMPTIGAALIILSTSAFLNRIVLSSRFMVLVGLISFPLYLWHWPILSFLRIIWGSTPPALFRIYAVCLGFLLSWLTYRYVERPIRYGQHMKTIPLVILMLIVGALGYWSKEMNGLEQRFNKPPLRIETGEYDCTKQEPEKPCQFGNLSSKKIIVLYGDSHAGHLTKALNNAMGDKYRVIFFGQNCFIGKVGGKEPMPWGISKSQCESRKAEMRQMVGMDVFAVIHAQHWANYQLTTKEMVESQVSQEIKAINLSPKKIIIIGGAPKVDTDCELARYYIPLRGKFCSSENKAEEGEKFFALTAKNLDVPRNVYFVFPYDKLCSEGTCRVIGLDASNYIDSNHLTIDGASLLMPDLIRILNQ